MARGLAIVFLLAGCIDPGEVACSNGTVCPASFACSAQFGCLSPGQLAACSKLGDGDACSVPGLGTGTCSDGGCVVARCGDGVVEPGEVCDDGNQVNGDGCNGTCTSDESCGNGISELDEECDCGDPDHPGPARCDGTYNGGAICSDTCKLRRCGNGVLDPGEVCDDGNNIPGDGCNFDCTSNETCGNGIVDYFAGEQCDDGNVRNRDGCSANCRVEAFEWSSSDQTAPPALDAPSIAYDAGRQRIVVFGGGTVNGFFVTVLDDTWELDGATWIHRTPITSPPARSGGAMTYDGARGRIVLFGGTDSSDNVLGDTWEYDGTTWTLRTPATSPPARSNALMFDDAAHGHVVMFGGNGGFADTWQFDGTTWTQLATGPAVNPGGAITYDAALGCAVMFGPDITNNTRTWEFDGTTWTQLSGFHPSTRTDAGMAYDAGRGRVVLFGGTTAGTPMQDTWEFDGAWTAVSATTKPPARQDPALAYDPVRGHVVMFGGFINTDIEYAALADTWEYTGSTWNPEPAPQSPAAAVTIGFDPTRALTLVLDPSVTTWQYDGTAWRIRPGTSPSVGWAVMTFDLALERFVMFDGTNTWTYDGTTWTNLGIAGPGVLRAAMTYDSARQRVVLFGGMNTTLQNTWEFDGTSWTEVAMTGPPGRYDASMIYDTVRSRVVLFGGFDGGDTMSDTWEYDGTTWTNTMPASSPPGRTQTTMIYDPVGQRTLVFGGLSGNIVGGAPLADTWQYDGTTWTQILLGTAPPARYGAAASYDMARQQMVVFGGSAISGNNVVPLSDTWTLGFAPQVASEACESGIDYDHDGTVGCADSDCWGACSPLCPPGSTGCPATPTCGDGTCTEDCRSCPADCPVDTLACPSLCGDFHCDAPAETNANCPGDCP